MCCDGTVQNASATFYGPDGGNIVRKAGQQNSIHAAELRHAEYFPQGRGGKAPAPGGRPEAVAHVSKHLYLRG